MPVWIFVVQSIVIHYKACCLHKNFDDVLGARLAIPGVVDLSDLVEVAQGVAKIVLESTWQEGDGLGSS